MLFGSLNIFRREINPRIIRAGSTEFIRVIPCTASHFQNPLAERRAEGKYLEQPWLLIARALEQDILKVFLGPDRSALPKHPSRRCGAPYLPRCVFSIIAFHRPNLRVITYRSDSSCSQGTPMRPA